jgi:hypothetical protein
MQYFSQPHVSDLSSFTKDKFLEYQNWYPQSQSHKSLYFQRGSAAADNNSDLEACPDPSLTVGGKPVLHCTFMATQQDDKKNLTKYKQTDLNLESQSPIPKKKPRWTKKLSD